MELACANSAGKFAQIFFINLFDQTKMFYILMHIFFTRSLFKKKPGSIMAETLEHSESKFKLKFQFVKRKFSS